MSLHVLGIACSPRRGGNSETLLDHALAGVESEGAKVEKLVLSTRNISPCSNCGGCDETGQCVKEDDMAEVHEKLLHADKIILSSPIFFGSITAQAKMMIDRCQCFWVEKFVLKRKRPKREGIFLCVGGFERNEFFKITSKVVRIFFTVLDVRYISDLFYPGIDKKGDIKEHPTALKDAFEAGRSLVNPDLRKESE